MLTQGEADTLIAMDKHRVDAKRWDYPGYGEKIAIPLVSTDRRERFFLDLHRSRIDVAKGTYQNRGRQSVILVRLDFGNKRHRNPDHRWIGSPHLHLYREGHGDQWAYPVPSDQFTDLTDAWQTLQDFMQFCNIVDPPVIQQRLFI